jgi:hypothetical protein
MSQPQIAQSNPGNYIFILSKQINYFSAYAQQYAAAPDQQYQQQQQQQPPSGGQQQQYDPQVILICCFQHQFTLFRHSHNIKLHGNNIMQLLALNNHRQSDQVDNRNKHLYHQLKAAHHRLVVVSRIIVHHGMDNKVNNHRNNRL